MTQVGAYLGTTASELSSYQQWLGRSLDNVLVSVNQTGWSAFDSSLSYDVAQWQPTGKNIIWSVPLTVTGTSLEQTATGIYNGHYAAAAQALAKSEPSGTGPIYVRVGWEFNLDQPWAAAGHEQAFIQSYQNLVDTFRSVSDRFKFVWDPNIGGSYNPAQAYPGDKYVDVIGSDFYYNPQFDGTDGAKAFATKVSEPYGLQWQQDFAAQHGKPTAVSEWGVDTNDSAAYVKAAQQWFTDHNMIYENYWESNAAYSGELHKGADPTTGAAFQQAFGAASAVATASMSLATGSVNTGSLSGGGAVTADLAGGTISQGGSAKIALSRVTDAQLGADATTVYGLTSGNARVQAGTGALSFYGQGANDTIMGGPGGATIMGGSGAESFTSRGGTNVMFGGTGQNTMVAGIAARSQDTFYGQGGTDTIRGGAGTLTVYGGKGTETIHGGSGKTVIYGGSGDAAGVDIEYAGTGTTLLYEGSGTDYFASNAGTATIFGGSGHSYVYGGTGSQTIYTGAGNQYVSAGWSSTTFYDLAAHLTAGRFDQIDGFSGGKSTQLYLPGAVQGATTFAAENGGTAILTATGGGVAEIFVSGASVAAVQAHTHFTI